MYNRLEKAVIGIIRENAIPPPGTLQYCCLKKKKYLRRLSEGQGEAPPGPPLLLRKTHQALRQQYCGTLAGQIKALVFDIYGTLFISNASDIDSTSPVPSPNHCIDRLLHRFGVNKNSSEVKKDFIEEIGKEHERLRNRDIDFPEVQYEKIWGKVLGLDDMALLKKYAAAYEMLVNPVYPMPWLSEVLAAIKEKPLEMGIISNAQFFTPLLFPAFLDTPIEELGFKQDLVFYSYRHGHAKPSVYMYRKAREILKSKGIEAGETIYVGNDIRNDILPAQRVGFQAVLFAGDSRSLRMRQTTPPCNEVVPDAIVTELRQILAWL